MRKLIAVSLALAFVGLLCEVAFSEEPAAKPQQEEIRQIWQRIRELNQKLAKASAAAMKAPEVVKAFEAVRKAEEAARDALDAAIVKANPDLAEAVKERKALIQKLPPASRGRFLTPMMGPPRGEGAPRPEGVPERPRRRERPAGTEGEK